MLVTVRRLLRSPLVALLTTAATMIPGWPPAHLGLGLASPPGGASHTRTLHMAYRYQYLSGGADTGHGWATWNPGGTFVTRYVHESVAAHVTPVFTYYQLLQSDPSRAGAEAAKDLANLADPSVMRAYFADLALALTRAHAAEGGHLVVVHVEPDLWGYIEQAARADDPATIPAAVASSGDARLAGLPNTAAGFAQAVVRLRDALAPGVALGWHLSTWGTKTDPVLQNPTLRAVDALAARSARFYANFHASFDAIFSDPSDRDDGFKTRVEGNGGAGRWTAGDYARDARWLRDVHRATHLPIVMWQIPLGNSTLPNTTGRYRDTHVQALLGGSRRALTTYRNAGVVALLFGGGAAGTTTEKSDGGLFGRLAARYARLGALPVR